MNASDIRPYTHRVQYYETDKMQVTHHSNYLRFLEEARIDFLDQIGWGYAKMEEEGIISPVLSLTCDYRHATTFPDVLTICVAIEKLSAVRLTLGYTVRCGERTVCTATTTHCFIGDGSPESRRNRCRIRSSLILGDLKTDAIRAAPVAEQPPKS